MLVNICMKFHEGILNGFCVTEQTQPYRKIYHFQFQRTITLKIRNPELRFLHSSRRHILLYICIKFHDNISNAFWVTEWPRFCDRQTALFSISKGHNSEKYAIQSYGSCALHVVSCCFTFVWSFMKISQTVFELQSGHDFVTDRRPGLKQYVSQP